MPYQSTGSCRFYINVFEWLASNDAYTLSTNNLRTLPVSRTPQGGFYWDVSGTMANMFVAILGHTMSSSSVPEDVDAGKVIAYISQGGIDIELTNVINSGADSYSIEPEYDGFSISTFVGKSYANFVISTPHDIGSLIIGNYYDMPHSSDLKMTMSYGEMDGVKRIRTKGGSDLVKHQYKKPPLWGTAAPWELYQGNPVNQKLSRIGRRTWDLSFSYLSDSDVFGSNQSISNRVQGVTYQPFYQEGTGLPDYGDWTSDSGVAVGFNYNILTDDNFYSQVIHKTNGGQLPFIFQPDKNDNTNFAICKFDQKSFSFQQISPSLYSVKMKIREVW